MKDLKVALVHDFLTQFGGAERVLEALAEIFPKAPIYTLLYDPEKFQGKFQKRVIQTSCLQKLPKFLRKNYRLFLPLFPSLMETMDLRDYNLVISSSGAWSKGIVTRLNTIHFSYIHSPMRFVWDCQDYVRQEGKEKWNFFLRPLFSYLRIWDRLAAVRPDYLIANSRYTLSRIEKYYRRDSRLIYPPVKKMEAGSLPKRKNEEKYFLVVSRLSAYKKIFETVTAFNKLGLPLVIVGSGREERRLKKIAANNIRFLAFQPEEKMPLIYAGARAFLFPGIDDFGLAPLEAMSFGVPVIALKKGGALEYMVEGKNGEFLESCAPDMIADGVRRFFENEKKYERNFITGTAEKFSRDRFEREIRDFIREKQVKN